MQLIESFVIQLPVVIACVALVMAAMRKTGKEKGAGFIDKLLLIIFGEE